MRAEIELFAVDPGSASGAAVLFRALRDDVAWPFVGVARGRGPYELVCEDGAVDGPGGVLLIEPFAVPVDDDERFLAGWQRVRDVFTGRRGYLGTRLYRGTAPAGFRYIHVGRWSSPLMVFRITREPEFQAAAAALGFPARPSLYQPVGRSRSA